AGNLWGALNPRGASGTPGLYLIDPATGAATFQRPIVDALGHPPSGGVVALHFGCNGVLYGGTARALSEVPDITLSANDGGALLQIAPSTGLFLFVGTTTPGGDSLGALAFDTPCGARPTAVPTLSGWAMIAMTAFLLVFGAAMLRRRQIS